MDIIELPDLLIPSTAVGAAVWLFYRLLVRADRREQDAFREVKAQRDFYRGELEDCQAELYDAHQEIARLRAVQPR